MREWKEVSGGFVVAGGEASAFLEPREQMLGLVAFLVDSFAVRVLNFAVAFGGVTASPPCSWIACRTLSLVGNHVSRRESLQQRYSLSDVVRLNGCQQRLHRFAKSIACLMNLRSESAT